VSKKNVFVFASYGIRARSGQRELKIKLAGKFPGPHCEG